jgi:acetyl esterase/lipase
MVTALEIVLTAIAAINLVLTRFALFKLHQPTTPFVWFIKVFVSGLSPILFLTSLVTTFLGVMATSIPVLAMSVISASLYTIHIVSITTVQQSGSLKKMLNDPRLIPDHRQRFFLRSPYVIQLPHLPESILHRDIPFHTIENSNRQLLCDVWQPPTQVKHSGLAFIYLHGSAWTHLDKDYGSRSFFRRITAQGHVVMDVAYRLFPETGFMGMVHDTKHAIAWMKANADQYGIDSTKIVIGGGSAGAHLALLAAYTPGNSTLTPFDLLETDVSVAAAISLYGQTNLTDTYYHTCQHLDETSHGKKTKDTSVRMPAWMKKRMGKDFNRLGFDKHVEPGKLQPMLGGTPAEKPEAYALFSPITHVDKNAPPTLIIHGEQDILAPLKAIRTLKRKLTFVGVPVSMNVFPQTDHAFDFILPTISPSAHAALYIIERFLAIYGYRQAQQVVTPVSLNRQAIDSRQ